MKFRAYQKKRKICYRIKSCMAWLILIGIYRLSCIVGCIEQYHMSLEEGVKSAAWVMLAMCIALAIHQIANHINYREIGRYIETKK